MPAVPAHAQHQCRWTRYGPALRLRRPSGWSSATLPLHLSVSALAKLEYKLVPCAVRRRAWPETYVGARATPAAGRARSWHAAVRHVVGYVRCGAILLLRPAPARSARGGGVERARAVRISWSRGGWMGGSGRKAAAGNAPGAICGSGLDFGLADGAGRRARLWANCAFLLPGTERPAHRRLCCSRHWVVLLP
jgi:hypothetical protein